jgi:hypothetical protein
MYENIPDYTIRTINNWVNDGWQPGGFVTAVLENDLAQAFARADDNNTRAMAEIVQYVWNEIPGNCWGSKQAVLLWKAKFVPDNDGDRSMTETDSIDNYPYRYRLIKTITRENGNSDWSIVLAKCPVVVYDIITDVPENKALKFIVLMEFAYYEGFKDCKDPLEDYIS